MLERWTAWKKANVWHSRSIALAVFTVWLCLVLVLVRHHAFWRDEVRVLSLATRGDLISMIESLRGEGHPALWFLLIRGAYFLIGSTAVLWIVSVGVAGAAGLLLALWSPFGWLLVALFLFGRIAIFEYSVMSRNYGISMLLMFLFAACYPRYRDRSMVLGVVLFLLANTHALSVLIVGAFLFFYFVDVISTQRLRWTPVLRVFLLNFGIATAGVLACFATIYPPSADAISTGIQKGVELRHVVAVILEPARTFGELAPTYPWNAFGLGWAGNIIMSLVMFGSILGLIRSPAALIAALGVLIGFSLFFTLVYPGSYRHQALWLVFLISMYWITRDRGTADRLKPKFACASAVGSTLAVLLVSAQLVGGFHAFADVALGVPLSRSRDFSTFLNGRQDLKDAVIIADPDYLLEALPYYISNPTYLMREQRYGNVVPFTKNAILRLDLDDILNVARKLHQERGEPVLILMAQSLEPGQPAMEYSEGYNWKLVVAPDQVRRFLESTQRLVRFGPAQLETFDVYLLKPTATIDGSK